MHCYRDPVYSTCIPLISKVLQYPSTLPSSIVYYTPCYYYIILDTTKEDINKEIGKAPN
jgi:hypothetical protein